MGKKDNKPRGRMSAYAFFVQTCREEHKKKHPSETVVFAEFSKKCAERWKTMSEKEKKRFHDMAEKDKKRFATEMSDFKSAGGTTPEKGGRKRKRTKDPNAPKRALSAFFWFCNDERSKVKGVNPDWTVGEVAKELGRRWNEVGDERKSKYEALAAKDKGRYEKEMAVYKASDFQEVKAYKGKKTKTAPAPPAKGKRGGGDDDESEGDEDEEEIEEDSGEEEDDD